MNSNELYALEDQVLLKTYSRPDFTITHGNGVFLYDTKGREYLDFVAGIAVNAFGYHDPVALQALRDQAEKLWHCSNLYHTEPQVRLAKKLVDATFADRVFFSNSGTEAIEGAIKFARKWGYQNKGESCFEIIAFYHSFHGRTLGALSATGQEKFWQGFKPLLPGFRFAQYNDIESVKKVMSPSVCAVLLEPVQGESGIRPADEAFLQDLCQLTKDNRALLILDEIQCGLGRTGYFSAHDYYGITPDLMTIAKPLAGGLPLGAILLTAAIADHIQVGNHGTTFGGGPLATRVAETVVDRVQDPAFLQHVQETGAYLLQSLRGLQAEFSFITEVRGRGLMAGMDIELEVKTVLDQCHKNGLLLCRAGEKTVRFLPPLIVEKQHIDSMISKLSNTFKQVQS